MAVLLKLFLNKYVLGGLAVVAILFAAFETGKSKGYDAGHQAAWDTQQQTINKMVDAQNAATELQNKKISGFEFSANAAQMLLDKQKAATQQATSNAVAAYKKAHPTDAASCGFTIPTVQVINQILKAGETQ